MTLLIIVDAHFTKKMYSTEKQVLLLIFIIITVIYTNNYVKYHCFIIS